MRGVLTLVGFTVTLIAVAGCSGDGGESSAPPRASASVSPSAPSPSATLESRFFACLRTHGVRLPEDDRAGGNEQRINRGIEKCASLMEPGQAVLVRVTEGNRFQACLAEHGVELPEPGRKLSLIRGRDRAMDAALEQC